MADASSSALRQSERTTHLMRVFRPRRPIEVFLDVGCGTGTITREIQAAYDIPLAVGIDLHPGTATDNQEAEAAALEFGLAVSPSEDPVPVSPPAPPARRLVAPMAIDFDDEPLVPPPNVPPPSKAAAKPLTPPPRNNGPGKKTTRYMYRQLKNDVIPLPDNSVDLVTVFMAIHHFDRFEQMLSELQRVLRPDGFLFIREHDVPRNDSLLRKTLDNLHASFSDHMTSGTTNYWPREDLRAFLVEHCGLRHVLDDDYPPDVPNPQHIYHSLYAKQAALTDLKYVPPSERSTKTAAPATNGSKAKSGKAPAGKGDGARMSENWRK